MTLPIKWDKIEPVVSADGIPLIRYAISDRDGVCLEMSMHDDTIKNFVSDSLCFAVKSFPTNTAKIDPIAGGGFVALLKIGNPNDQAGNLIFIRVKTVAGFSKPRYAMTVEFTLKTVTKSGIRLDKHVMDTIRGN